MNNLAAGLGGAAVAVAIAASAMVFANRSNEPEADRTEVAASTKTHTVCTEQKVVTEKKWGTNSVVGTVLGGAAGGVVGHQIGGGHGKDIATAVGAAGGAYAGHEIANNKFPDQKVSTRENCREVPG